jgi:hypothetical protein
MSLLLLAAQGLSYVKSTGHFLAVQEVVNDETHGLIPYVQEIEMDKNEDTYKASDQSVLPAYQAPLSQVLQSKPCCQGIVMHNSPSRSCSSLLPAPQKLGLFLNIFGRQKQNSAEDW